MAQLLSLDEFRPPKLKHADGEPVRELPGLVYFQDCPIPEDAWRELAQRLTNGWLEDAA